MAEAIQFPCPICGTTLRLPLGNAGSRGPCPRCRGEIVAPDPFQGIGAFAPAAVPAPVADMAPAPPQDVQEAPIPNPPAPPAPAPRAEKPQRAILVLSILLTAVVSLATGYLIGLRSDRLIAPVPPAAAESPPRGGVPASPEPPTKIVMAKPPAAMAKPEPVSQPERIRTTDAAEAALKAFLAAPDWTTRGAYVLSPERVRPAMEAYSRKAPDGPTAYLSLTPQDSLIDKASGNTQVIFLVATEKCPNGFPVVVSDTKSGWLVDWESFVEFRDDLFGAFAEGPANQSGRFHLLVSDPPEARAKESENEHFASFLLGTPASDTARLAYVRKTAEIHQTLAAATGNGALFAPVLEVAKKETPDGKGYLEIVSIIAPRWLPEQAD